MPKEDKILENLTKIRELLTPKPAPPPPKGIWKPLMEFISKYKVMGLAVAFIISFYLGALVKSLVADLIMRARKLPSSIDNIHNRSPRNLHTSKNHKKMEHRISLTNPISCFPGTLSSLILGLVAVFLRPQISFLSIR